MTDMELDVELVELGTTVYLPVRWERIVIPCTVVEVQLVYTVADKTVWVSRYMEKPNSYFVGDEEKTKEELAQYEGPHSQFLHLDEPVGHGLVINDEVFLTLEDALQMVPPSKKKHLKRRLKRYRHGIERFITSTWARAGYDHPGFQKMPLKRVYVRR